MFLLIQFNIFSNSSIVVGTTTCLDEKSSPPEIDYLEIKIDTNQVVNISNSTLTLVLDDNIKQQFFDYVTLGLEFINTIESENITIEYSSEIGTIENNNRRIIVNFSTDGSIGFIDLLNIFPVSEDNFNFFIIFLALQKFSKNTFKAQYFFFFEQQFH